MINNTILAISAFIIGLVCSAAGGILAINILSAIGFVMFFITALALMPDMGGDDKMYYKSLGHYKDRYDEDWL